MSLLARKNRTRRFELSNREKLETCEVTSAPSAKRAGAITVVGQIVKGGVQLVALVAFSHLLSPYDVGLIAMLLVFIMLGEMIREFGLLQAAIQTEKLSHAQASNLFWVNAGIGLTLTLGLMFAASSIATMYNEPALQAIAPWIALTFTINALQMQFQVRLARDLRFFALTVTDALSQIIGLATGLVAAVAGAGYWSLVVQILAVNLSILVQRVIIAGWWPGMPKREPGMGTLYRFGLHSSLAQLLQFAASNLDSYLIGMKWGASTLGIYNRAFQMYSVPANQLLAPLTNVALPLLSQQRHRGGDFYPLLWKAQVAISSILTFVFVVIASLAEPLVRIALGSDWIGAAPLLSILCIGGAVQIFNYMNYWAFLASGSTKQLLYHSLVSKPLMAICIVIGLLGGLQGVAWGYTVGLSSSWFIGLVWLKRCDSMPVKRFLTSGLHVLTSGAVGGVGAWMVVKLVYGHWHIGAVIVVGLAVAAISYIPLIMARPSIRALLIQVGRPVLLRLKAALRKNG